MFKLSSTSPGSQELSFTVGADPVHLGRRESNDIVLFEPSISGDHAVLWVRDGELFVEDLRSRNGVYVNSQRIQQPTRMDSGDTLQLGSHSTFLVSALDSELRFSRLLVEDRQQGVGMPFTGARFTIGSAPGCDLRLEDAPLMAAVLERDDWDRVSLVEEEGQREVDVDEVFEVHGHEIVLRQPTEALTATVDSQSQLAELELVASLDGPTGPWAEVKDVRRQLSHRVEAGNRATLLYLLARQAQRDLANAVAREEAGWCDDREVAVGIWGKDARPRQLNVLLLRLRRELEAAGLDPWFLEKKRRRLRAGVTRARVAS